MSSSSFPPSFLYFPLRSSSYFLLVKDEFFSVKSWITSFFNFYVSLTLDLQDFPELLIPNQAYLLFIVVSGQIWDLQPNPLSSSRFPFLSDPHLKERKGSSESRKWWRNGWRIVGLFLLFPHFLLPHVLPREGKVNRCQSLTHAFTGHLFHLFFLPFLVWRSFSYW